jgi:hypothetical protein
MSESLGLGRIITTPQQRDAIHIAVVPVVATCYVYPGAKLRFLEGSTEKVTTVRQGGIGIADPFLERAVEEGQQFWMYLHPGSITSLRHDWTHPAFEPPPPPSGDPVGDSRHWIEQFAAEIDQTYNRLMAAADQWLDDKEYTYDNSETYKDYWNKFPEFWRHYEIVTGRKVEDKDDHFFTCSC